MIKTQSEALKSKSHQEPSSKREEKSKRVSVEEDRYSLAGAVKQVDSFTMTIAYYHLVFKMAGQFFLIFNLSGDLFRMNCAIFCHHSRDWIMLNILTNKGVNAKGPSVQYGPYIYTFYAVTLSPFYLLIRSKFVACCRLLPLHYSHMW